MPKVLVVDDSVSVRKVVEKALASRNFDVLSAATGTEAIEQIERERPDVVVCDVILPDKDGYQVCEYVRAHPGVGSTPVLLISGVVNSTVLARAAEAQSNDVMFKPFAADELVRKIDGLLGGQSNGGATARVAPATEVIPEPAPVAPAASPFPVPAAETALEAETAPPDLRSCLETLATTPGVRVAALADREGFLIEGAGEQAKHADSAAALAASLRESVDDIGRHLGQGALLGIIVEFESVLLLVHAVGDSALLALIVEDAAALGKIRYLVKRTVPELERLL